ncbi:MAG: hypothetical protein PHS49_00645 [Candidatus Gracilibacteria bacterium]|nr:hypothetical protein [Candidatus Gracilibacteria bacterium]
MKNYKEKFIGGIISGLGITLVIGISGIAYGAYVSMTDVTNGETLTASTFNQVLANIDSLNTTVSGLSNVPAGAVMAFNLSSCPSGWIEANGGSGTPDLRGEFIRGLDNGRGVDSGRTLNSWQAPSILTASIGPDAIQDLVIEGSSSNQVTTSDFYLATQTDMISDTWYPSTLKGSIYSISTAGYTGNSAGRPIDTQANRPLNNSNFFKAGGTRPRNVTLLYCVKQ